MAITHEVPLAMQNEAVIDSATCNVRQRDLACCKHLALGIKHVKP